jgi:hypothetical protein
MRTSCARGRRSCLPLPVRMLPWSLVDSVRVSMRPLPGQGNGLGRGSAHRTTPSIAPLVIGTTVGAMTVTALPVREGRNAAPIGRPRERRGQVRPHRIRP